MDSETAATAVILAILAIAVYTFGNFGSLWYVPGTITSAAGTRAGLATISAQDGLCIYFSVAESAYDVPSSMNTVIVVQGVTPVEIPEWQNYSVTAVDLYTRGQGSYSGTTYYDTVTDPSKVTIQNYYFVIPFPGSADRYFKAMGTITICKEAPPECPEIPARPCDEGVWEDYPTCSWDTSGCSTTPPPPPAEELPLDIIMVVILLGLVGGITYWRFR